MEHLEEFKANGSVPEYVDEWFRTVDRYQDQIDRLEDRIEGRAEVFRVAMLELWHGIDGARERSARLQAELDRMREWSLWRRLRWALSRR